MERPFVVPFSSAADPVSAASLVVNPATHLPAGTFEIIHSDGPAQLPVSGEGLYLVLGSGLGLATEWGRSPGDIDHVLFTLGQSFAFSDDFSLGVDYAFSPKGVGDYRYDSWSAGALWTPTRHVALGVAGRHLNHPSGRGPGGGYRLDPRLQAGVAIRPLGTSRLSLTADVVKDEGAVESYVFGVRGEPVAGLELFAASNTDGELTAGITIRQSHGNFRGHAVEPAGTVRPGWAFSLDTSTRRQNTWLRARPAFERIEISGTYADTAVRPLPFGPADETFADLIFEIDRIENDPTSDGLIVKLGSFGSGLAKAREVRAALERVSHAGKDVVCYADSLSTSTYIIGTGCDALLMSPTGNVFLTGLSASYQFLGGTLDKVGVDVEFVRRGKFKSSPELIAFDEPTDPFVEEMNELLDSELEALVSAVATGRGIDATRVKELIETGAFLADEAEQAHLIDGVAYWDEVRDFVKERVGSKPSVFSTDRGTHWSEDEWGQAPAIAVVYVSGAIVDGKNRTTPLTGSSMAGADSIRAALVRARKDPRVKAVVLRVDSPGGSSLASDLIWREASRLAEKKPLLVSMGDVAASGGYYVSAPAAEIFADEATVTGSIGVFILRPNLAGLYEKIGVHQLTLKRGEHSDLFTGNAPLTETQTATLEHLVGAFYQDFLERVSEGRDKSVEEVDAVAQGRVWTGRQAKDVGLVDQLGGLRAAITRAKELAEIPEHRRVEVIELPRPRGLLEQLTDGVPGAAPLARDDVEAGGPTDVIGSLETWQALGNEPASLLPVRFELGK